MTGVQTCALPILEEQFNTAKSHADRVTDAISNNTGYLAMLAYSPIYPDATDVENLEDKIFEEIDILQEKIKNSKATLDELNSKIKSIFEFNGALFEQLKNRVTKRKSRQIELLEERDNLIDERNTKILEIQETSINKEDYAKLSSFAKNTKQARNNRLLDIMQGVLTNPHTLNQFVKPGGFFEFQRNANIVYLHSLNAASYQELNSKSDKALNDMVEVYVSKEGIDLTSPLSLAKMFNRNMTGAKLVGIFANHNAHHSVIQHTNLALGKFPLVMNNIPYANLHKVQNADGEFISNVLAGYLAASVDNAKDPNAFKANINTYTADVLALLTRLGVPMQETLLLLKQPIIVDLVSKYYIYGGDFTAERKAIEAIATQLGLGQAPNISKMESDVAITNEQLIEGIGGKRDKSTEIAAFYKFLLYKDRATSLADLIRAMRADTSGTGPNMANNEITLRLQRDILEDSNLIGVLEIFNGEVYPMFRAFNYYGLIEPHNLLSQLFPLADISLESVAAQVKFTFKEAVNKKQLSVKDVIKLNNSILTYVGTLFPQFPAFEKDFYIKDFPAKYKKLLEDNPDKVDDYLILDNIKYAENDKFEFPVLEFNNTGAVDKGFKEDLKNSWYDMFFDEDPYIRALANDLIQYSVQKEGYIFGPKTFAHLIPTRFYLNPSLDGFEINNRWNEVLSDSSLGLSMNDVDNIVNGFIENNWQNSQYVQEVSEEDALEVNTTEEGKLISIDISNENPLFFSSKTK